LAVFEEFAEGQLLARARSLWEQFQRDAFAWQRQHAFTGDLRGVGPTKAMEFVDADGSAYAPAAKKLLQHCLYYGVLV
jgi:4-aminobutyrate aminotransferase / (S)-3-amino-2-methylpropionate transaminase / 5-aminovalerate transaminase